MIVCCDSPNLLQFSVVDATILFSHFGRGDWYIGELWLVSRIWTDDNCRFLRSVWNNVTTGGKSVAFRRRAFSLDVCSCHSLTVSVALRVPGYRSRGPGFDFRRYQNFREVRLDRGPPGHVSKTDELLEWKSRGSGSRKPRLTDVGISCADHAALSIRKSWHQLHR
jgi:hypothetical protein